MSFGRRPAVEVVVRWNRRQSRAKTERYSKIPKFGAPCGVGLSFRAEEFELQALTAKGLAGSGDRVAGSRECKLAGINNNGTNRVLE